MLPHESSSITNATEMKLCPSSWPRTAMRDGPARHWRTCWTRRGVAAGQARMRSCRPGTRGIVSLQRGTSSDLVES